MSLIQEALRRREEERAGLGKSIDASGVAPAAERSPKEDLSSRGNTPPAKGRNVGTGRPRASRQAVVSVLMVICAVALGGLFLLVRVRRDQQSKEVLEQSVPPARAVQESGPTPANQKGDEPVGEAPSQTEMKEPEAPDPATSTHRPKAKHLERWPMLTLTGVFGQGSSGSAILNGQLLEVGETIEGVKVVSIREQGVELEYGGETFFLKVGRGLK